MHFLRVVGRSEFAIPIREAFENLLSDAKRFDIETEIRSRIREIVGEVPFDDLSESQMRLALKSCRKNITLRKKTLSATDERTIH